MAKAGWSVSVKNASTATLMEPYQLLKASDENRAQALEIQASWCGGLELKD